MLLPALLGYFVNKNTKQDRFDVVQKSQVVNTLLICALNLFTLLTDSKYLLFSDFMVFMPLWASNG